MIIIKIEKLNFKSSTGQVDSVLVIDALPVVGSNRSNRSWGSLRCNWSARFARLLRSNRIDWGTGTQWAARLDRFTWFPRTAGAVRSNRRCRTHRGNW